MTRARDAADQINRVNSSAANATAITVDASENVGIGTAAPSFPLSVQSNSSAEGLLILGRSSDDIGEIAFRENDNSTALGELQYRQDHAILRHRVGDLRFATGGTTERMRIDATGAVTMPAQPAFLAQVATVQSNLANYVTVAIFGTEVFDQNADFNNSTGVFTAPVTGKYMLSTMLRLDQIPPTGTGVLQVQFATSNRTVFAMFDPIVFDTTSTAQSFSQSLLMDMDAGDTAKVQVYMPVASSTVDIATTSFFSGYLVA